MFQWKSNSEKFFKCFQHISMKHRPSWNHLDLKQMHWLFSQQALLLGAGTGALARVARRGFQPPALVCDSLWLDQYQGEPQRKLREDYEDEVSDRITLQDLFFLSPWISSASDRDGTASGYRLKGTVAGGREGWLAGRPLDITYAQSLAIVFLAMWEPLGKGKSSSNWGTEESIPGDREGLSCRAWRTQVHPHWQPRFSVFCYYC